jgi:hypothetical protein
MKKTAIYCCLLLIITALQPSHSQVTLAEWNFPNNPDDAIADVAVPINATKTLYTVGGTAAVGYGTNTGATTQCAWTTGWDGGSGTKWWEIEINTTGYYNLELSSKQRSSATGPKNFAVEYKIGIAGTWTAIAGAGAIVAADNFTSAVLTNIALPASCENQPSVFLRWIMTSNTNVGGTTVASAGSSRIDDVIIKSHDSQNHYRSVATGNWNSLSTWQSSPDLITWSAATYIPTYYSKTITIRSGHTVSITSDIRIDETTIDAGGIVNYNSKILTINNGAGVDLQVNGSFTDGSSSNAAWMAGATWALGTNGTYTKTENTNAVNWQNNYEGGISTIPATANWVLNKTPSSVTTPSLTTINMFYPNLTIMNTSGGLWTTSVASTFTGSTATATVKGNLDIGGALAPLLGTVDFLNDNSNATPVQVLGNLTIRSGCNLRNFGTGFEIYGNITVNGSASYGTANARKFKISGSNAQSISGSAAATAFQIYQLEMTKTANVLTLNRTIKIDNNLNLVNGIIVSSAANLITIENGATATSASNASFVRGPVQKIGPQSFVFPTGKNSSYRPIAMGADPTGGAIVFWSENFSSGAGWSLANVTGAEGANPNPFVIGAAEGGGILPGGCGVANNGNNTLHVSSYINPSGGAAYDAGGLCGFLTCPLTNRMAQSPVINCTGKTNITVNFNYLEYGDGTNDNATLWYFDGSAWSQLSDMPKTACCGGACNGFRQGQWTAFSVALPASANNNANVKIGFKWQNNDDGVGTDPSFAVDDITLSQTSPSQFTAEYFRANPQLVYGPATDPTLDHISQCEYWTLNQTTGTSLRTITLSWDATSCGVTLLNDLRIARWRSIGSIWNDLGNGGTTGSIFAGTITTAAADNLYGPFTLSSVSSENPLPITLITFSGQHWGDKVKLHWKTASEYNSSYFEIERSAPNQLFEPIGRVNAAGYTNTLSNYYFYDDAPLNGLSYYRLKSVDHDGSFKQSNTIALKSDNPSTLQLIYVVAINGKTLAFKAKGVNDLLQAELYDASGALVLSAVFKGEKDYFEITTPPLAKGVYALKVTDGVTVCAKRFVIDD